MIISKSRSYHSRSKDELTSVIYDFNCNDLFIYDLNRFVNKMTFTHKMINTLNDFMLIEEYEIMFIINRINEKNRRMFFDNIVDVSFIILNSRVSISF
jgi:hypothetical protein